jgi:DHA3 family macrolide efflux protein-like MFS transporter
VKSFFVLWASQAASMFGSAVVGFALAWYLAKETGSATILSTAMMVNFLPIVILGPFIGPLIDRWNRKKIMIYSDLITALLTLVLVFLFYTETVQLWHIYVIMAGRAAGGAFQMPALRASLPMIVPEKYLVRANGFFITLRGSVNIVAPPAGAFLIDALHMQWVLSVDIITAIIAISCLLPLVIPQPASAEPPIKPGYFSDIKESFRYIAAWRGLLFLVILAAMLNFLAAPVNALLPLFVINYLGADVLRFGWLQTAFGVGIIAGGLIIGAWGGFKRRIITSFTSILLWSISIFAFGFTTENLFFLALTLILISGLTIAMMNAPVGAIFQLVVAKDMQGRFHSLYGSLIGAMAPVGLAIAGPLSDAIGLRTIWYVSGAVIFFLFTAGFFSRDLMTLEDEKIDEKSASGIQ